MSDRFEIGNFEEEEEALFQLEEAILQEVASHFKVDRYSLVASDIFAEEYYVLDLDNYIVMAEVKVNTLNNFGVSCFHFATLNLLEVSKPIFPHGLAELLDLKLYEFKNTERTEVCEDWYSTFIDFIGEEFNISEWVGLTHADIKKALVRRGLTLAD